ncbi:MULTISPECIES: ABC transporter ATP-binding protein [unclassified Streptomyces]|uniref:ABC transporter ATP-binding protein n=1 Tax=unclassified Streptomyces TaxID=2593676 RepID=UPI00225A7726|nr:MULTISPECIES: ABC transporter ATP-binding protein [unclassified Streptomyces]WSP59699.1 ABC transporter ATP-binding protein [Streptomyces sp. NBC_01241]WSU19783.1 ABC transporter ATP-binding protein [Streptomyces sp. NBC_01108]MCX4791511.1 ABC transporter ATP-binding protein [Streptomyces sp. NBC_01221]MCX4792785.1 ABC transporter ATP-binding protein [Streptomyces sp. NBC_01242]WSP60706.1 ABC transporter ATP-binding protein [Streptomyces sp. NBC_01240]
MSAETSLIKARGARIELAQVRKEYADSVAVDDVSLVIEPGEFMTLLGPSGSGKTTTLNIIAGFTAATSGTLTIGGVQMQDLPPHRRDIGMVFQHYALFPHMTVAQNVAFPLKQRKVPKARRTQLVEAALETVRLGGYGHRRPSELSGGQQQRVALARAVVYEPRVLLMDEPLGALDKKLRESLQLEIKRVHQEIGSTFVFVTHDQEEALVLSDRIAVFDDGGIQQVGTASELYEKPRSLFVAEFLGESSTVRGRIEPDGDDSCLRVGDRTVRAPGRPADGTGTDAAVVIRPEHLRVQAADAPVAPGANALPARVTQEIYLGSGRKLELALPDGTVLLAREQADRLSDAHHGDEVTVVWDVERGVLLGDTPGTTHTPTPAGRTPAGVAQESGR